MREKVLKFLLWITITLNVFIASSLLYAYTSHIMPYHEQRATIKLTYNTSFCKDYTRSELREKINRLTGVKHYIYKESNQTFNTGAGTNLFINIVVVNKTNFNDDYVIYLTHELTHIKHHCANERYTQYQTFVTLYESEEFHAVGLYMADMIQKGWGTKAYNCWAQVYNYLKADGYEKDI